MGISIGFGLGPIRFSAPLVSGRRRRAPIYTTQQYVAAGGRKQYHHAPRPDYGHAGGWRGLLLVLSLLLIPVAALLQVAMFAANGFWVGLVWLLFQLACVLPFILARYGTRLNAKRAEQARREAETAARADYEHAAMMRGEIGLGTYGAFQPRS